MSIITEALKKAEKEKDKLIDAREYLNKILGPEREGTYRRDELKMDKSQFQTKVSHSENEDMALFGKMPHRGSKTILITSGILLLLTIIFLTVVNVFLISPDVKAPTHIGTSDFRGVAVKAEGYTDVKPEIALIENKSTFLDKMTDVFKSDSVRAKFMAKFTLNGVICSEDDSWAIINNDVVRVGDTLGGAKVISIVPQKVTLLFKDERFDLEVK